MTYPRAHSRARPRLSLRQSLFFFLLLFVFFFFLLLIFFFFAFFFLFAFFAFVAFSPVLSSFLSRRRRQAGAVPAVSIRRDLPPLRRHDTGQQVPPAPERVARDLDGAQHPEQKHDPADWAPDLGRRHVRPRNGCYCCGVVAGPCFCGGFLADLSCPTRGRATYSAPLPHARCGMLYLVPVLIGGRLGLVIRCPMHAPMSARMQVLQGGEVLFPVKSRAARDGHVPEAAVAAEDQVDAVPVVRGARLAPCSPLPPPPHSTCAGHHGPLLGHRSAENATHLCARS